MDKQENFIKNARNAHGEKYNYQNVIYLNANSKVSIICAVHGEFLQSPYSHINMKRGCPHCAKLQRPVSRRSNNKWLSFAEARTHVHELKIKNISQWHEIAKDGKLPNNIPHNPRQAYSSQWMGWNDWLGKLPFRERLLSFEEARDVVRSFKLRSFEEWVTFCAVHNLKPDNIPFAPHQVYDSSWISWGDWLGYSSRSNGNMCGFLYIIQQADLPKNVYKIGRTYRPQRRLKEHERVNSSSFTTIKQYEVTNMKKAEDMAHQLATRMGELFMYGNSKEYFIIEDIAAYINMIEYEDYIVKK